MGGNVTARHNLGMLEESAGNMDRAVKHFMISAGAGHDRFFGGNSKWLYEWICNKG